MKICSVSNTVQILTKEDPKKEKFFCGCEDWKEGEEMSGTEFWE